MRATRPLSRNGEKGEKQQVSRAYTEAELLREFTRLLADGAGGDDPDPQRRDLIESGRDVEETS